MGGLYGKSMTSPRQIPLSPSRLRAQHRKLTAVRYYGNVMTTTIWRLRILHLQQYSRRLNLFVCFFTYLNYIFFGRQPRQNVKVYGRFGTNFFSIFKVCWWFEKPNQQHTENEEVFCSLNVWQISRYDVAACPGKFNWISFRRKFQNMYISTSITVHQDATYSVYYISLGSSKCFGCWHPSSGARTTVIAASGID